MQNRYEHDTAEGVLVIDKPAGRTSHDAVGLVRRLYGTQRVGHTGTLDPMATGVLVILVGRAAKAAEYITADEKAYTSTLLLGLTTDTADTTGAVRSRHTGPLPAPEEVKRAAEAFRGEILQVPPMVSALKVGGKKLLDLARQGIEVERQPRRIHISRLEVTPLEPDTGRYRLDVICSKGTYIRTLCEDLGAALGCGGVMETLRRTAAGPFRLESALLLSTLEAMTPAERMKALRPTESLFSDCPAVILPDFFARLAHTGNVIYQKKIGTAYTAGLRIRLCDREGFFALAEADDTCPDGSALRPIKQFRVADLHPGV